MARDIIPNNTSLLSLTTNTINNPLSNSVNSNELKNAQFNGQKNTDNNSEANIFLNQISLEDKSQMSSFQHALSSFMPNFMANLANNNSSSNSNLEEKEETLIKNIDPVNNQNDTLSDMSLLCLPINNTDSLFGSSVININLNNNTDLGVNSALAEQEASETPVVINHKEINGSISDSVQNNEIIGAFSRITNSKVENSEINIGFGSNNGL